MVYVDRLVPTFKTPRWQYDSACHMFADSIAELHLFAKKLGLNRSWFQLRSIPHYDLTKSKRLLAIKAGATEVVVDLPFIQKMRNLR